MSFTKAYSTSEDSFAKRLQDDWLRRKTLVEQLYGTGSKDMFQNPVTSSVGVKDASSLAGSGQLSPSQSAAASLGYGDAANIAASGSDAVKPAAASSTQTFGNGQISDDFEVKPGRYYSDVNALNINSLIQDPNQAMNYWANFQGYNDAYGQRVAGTFNIPGLLQAMGIGQGSAGQQLTGTNALDWYGRLADRLSGRLTDNGNNQYLNPQSIVQNIFATPKFEPGSQAGVSDISLKINNPGLQPEEQIGNVAQYVLGSLQGVLTNEQIDAYATILDQYATAFMRMYQTTPGGAGNMTFLEFIRSQTNQFGGMF